MSSTPEFRVVLQFDHRPKCFESDEQWKAWNSLHFMANAFAPCADCTPTFRAQMLHAHRCERPETVFCTDSDGYVTGISRDDPRFADLLLTGAARGLTPITAIERPTAADVDRLRRLAQLAHRRTAATIRAWIKTVRDQETECPSPSPSSSACPAHPAPATSATTAVPATSTSLAHAA